MPFHEAVPAKPRAVPSPLQLGVALCLAVLVVAATSPRAAADRTLRAELWAYGSLCDFKDAPNWPTKETRTAGLGLVAEGCEGLKERYGQPPAVRLTFANAGTTDWEIPLVGLASATVGSGGKSVAALAIRRRTSYGLAFTTEIKGTWIIHVKPAEIIDLVFLFPQAKRGDKVSIAGVASAKIE